MLNATQLQHLTTRLHEERDRLLEQLRAFEEVDASETSQDQSGDLSKVPTHLADLGTASSTEDLELSIGTRTSAELAEIDAALERIIRTPELFGLDEETGEPIAFARLDIIPYARIGAERKASAEVELDSTR